MVNTTIHIDKSDFHVYQPWLVPKARQLERVTQPPDALQVVKPREQFSFTLYYCRFKVNWDNDQR